MSQSNAVATKNEEPAATGMVAMIERMALSPDLNVTALESLLAMQERILARQAKANYVAAFATMKPLLPVIDRKGRIEVREKDKDGKRTGDLQQSTPFARWEDIDEAITPILHDHGFVLSFRTAATDDGKIIVTAVLEHQQDGLTHEERTSLPPMPFDTTGSKNNVQAMGSTLSYGKRYAATLLLNIRTKGEDDDGVKGDAPETITDDQVQELSLALLNAKIPADKFFKVFGIAALSELPATRWEDAKSEIANVIAIRERKKQGEPA